MTPCVSPKMDYGSGVWGYIKNEELETIHLKAMSFLGVNKYGTKAGMEGEIAWLNSNNRRKLEMLSLWNELTGLSDNRLPKINFNDMIASNATWIKNLRIIFTEINCAMFLKTMPPLLTLKNLGSMLLENFYQCKKMCGSSMLTINQNYIHMVYFRIHMKPKIIVLLV